MILILIFLSSQCLTSSCYLKQKCSQKEVIIKFNKGQNVINAKDFKLTLQTNSDKWILCDSLDNLNNNKKEVSIELCSNHLKWIFEYTNNYKNWNSIAYSIIIDTNRLKRIEINLDFTMNEKGYEFLKDFSIDKFYKSDSIEIHNKQLKLGLPPIFSLTSHLETPLWGMSSSNHFYGTIKRKTVNGWRSFAGSYCTSTIPEKPLANKDTVTSWIPYYNLEDEYIINETGSYKYIVAMGLERFSEGIPLDLYNKGQTRKRERKFYEVESEFEIK